MQNMPTQNHLNVQHLTSLDRGILQAGLNQSRGDHISGEYLGRLLSYDDFREEVVRVKLRNCHCSDLSRARVSGEVREPCQASCCRVKSCRSGNLSYEISIKFVKHRRPRDTRR